MINSIEYVGDHHYHHGSECHVYVENLVSFSMRLLDSCLYMSVL
jgi:hypothetical protein